MSSAHGNPADPTLTVKLGTAEVQVTISLTKTVQHLKCSIEQAASAQVGAVQWMVCAVQ